MINMNTPFMNLGLYEQGAAFDGVTPDQIIEQIQTYVRKLREDGYIDEGTAELAVKLDPATEIENLRDQVAEL